MQGEPKRCCKGCTWIDFDNDGYSDLFLDNLSDTGRLYRNNRDGTFAEVTSHVGIDGPTRGFHAGLGITTTTAGWISSPRVTTDRSPAWSRGCSASHMVGIPTGSFEIRKASVSRM